MNWNQNIKGGLGLGVDDGTRFKLPLPLIIFLLATIYAFCAFAISRELVIPTIFGNASGLIPGDPEYYDSLAKVRVGAMRESGLAAFEYAPGGHGVVGIVSLVYLLVPCVYGIVVLNAVLHGFASMTMFFLLRRWFSVKAAVLGVVPVLTAPYMMAWFSQPNKDSFVLAGVLLLVYGLTGLNSNDRSSVWKSVGIAMSGVFIIGWVKPYLNQILFPFVFIVLAWYVSSKLRESSSAITKDIALGGTILLALLLFFSQGGRSNDTLVSFYDFKYDAQQVSLSDQCLGEVSNWQSTQWLPGALDRRLKALAGQRCLIFSLLGNQDHPATLISVIERDFMPRNSAEMLAYIPRAMAIGELTPFPATWFQRPDGRFSTFYSLIPFEAVLVYAGIVGLAVFVIKRQAYGLAVPVSLAICVMTVYGMATPFIGALYRYRYPFWELLLCFGVAAIWSLIRSRTGTAR